MILLLATMTVYSQTNIQTLNYTFAYQHCIKLEGNISLPILETKGIGDIRQTVNDSLEALYKSVISEVDGYFSFNDDCDFILDQCASTEYLEMKYSIELNSDSLLSLVVLRSRTAGNCGHGSNTSPYCFNLNLQSNEMLTIDSLFNKDNKDHLINFAKEEVASEFGVTEPYDYMYFEGISISTNSLTLHYNFYSGNSIYLLAPVEIPFTEVKKYIKGKYKWILPN